MSKRQTTKTKETAAKQRAEAERAFERQIKEDVDQGWKAFWAKRNRTKPPYVSNRWLGVFENQ